MTRIGFNMPPGRQDVPHGGEPAGEEPLQQGADPGQLRGPGGGAGAADGGRPRCTATGWTPWASSAPSCRRGSTSWARGCAPAGTAARRGWPRSRTAGLDPKELIVTDFTPEWTGKTTATGYLGGTWAMANKATKAPDEAVRGAPLPHQPGAQPGHRGGHLHRRLAQVPGQVRRGPGPGAAPLLRGPGAGPGRLPQITEIDDIRNNVRVQLGEALEQKTSVKEALANMVSYANTKLATQWLAPRPHPVRGPGCCSSPAPAGRIGTFYRRWLHESGQVGRGDPGSGRLRLVDVRPPEDVPAGGRGARRAGGGRPGRPGGGAPGWWPGRTAVLHLAGGPQPAGGLLRLPPRPQRQGPVQRAPRRPSRRGVRRVILCSSINAVNGYPRRPPGPGLATSPSRATSTGRPRPSRRPSAGAFVTAAPRLLGHRGAHRRGAPPRPDAGPPGPGRAERGHGAARG